MESTTTLKRRFKTYNTKKMIENGELFMFDFNLTEKQKEDILKNFDSLNDAVGMQKEEQKQERANSKNVIIIENIPEEEDLEQLFQLNKSHYRS